MQAGWGGYSAWPVYVTQQLPPVQKHLPLTFRVTLPAANVVGADVFGTGIVH
jgi:hypothetical protein